LFGIPRSLRITYVFRSGLWHPSHLAVARQASRCAQSHPSCEGGRLASNSVESTWLSNPLLSI
jgi:hypothetical protein